MADINPISTLAAEEIKKHICQIEKRFDADVLYLNGPISSELIGLLQFEINELRKETTNKKLCVMLTTNGGDANTTERVVYIFRHFYDEVEFIIPDHAYSAGTILCMSGDRIWMNYGSVLGPIDPQVINKEGKFVPALGYLEKINSLLVKAQNNTLSEAEFLILKDFDLAELSQYEQARDLTTELLKDWLVKYKFKNWNTHSSSKKPVSLQEKKKRAEKIAKDLADYSHWKSHGRPLNIEVLTKELKLQIDDFGMSDDVQDNILSLQSIVVDFMRIKSIQALVLTRRTNI